MKIGVSAFAWTTKFQQRHLGILPGLREHGIEVFEIGMFEPEALPAAEIRRACEATGIDCTVCAIMPAGVNPISPDAAVRLKAKEHLWQCVKTAAEMGAKLIAGPVYAPIGYLVGRCRNPDEWAWAVEALQGLSDALDQHGITLAVEPVNRSESFLLNTAAEAKALVEAVAHPRIGVTVDTFHANIEEKNIATAVRDLGPALRHLHVSENDRGVVGSGHIDFPGIMAALKEIGYAGTLMIEGFGYSAAEPDGLGRLWGDLTVSPEDIAYKGAAYLKHLLA